MKFWFHQQPVVNIQDVKMGLLVKPAKVQIVTPIFKNAFEIYETLGEEGADTLTTQIYRSIIYTETNKREGIDLRYTNSSYPVGKMKINYGEQDPNLQIECSVKMQNLLKYLGFPDTLTQKEIEECYQLFSDSHWLQENQDLFGIGSKKKQIFPQETYYYLMLISGRKKEPSELEPMAKVMKKK